MKPLLAIAVGACLPVILAGCQTPDPAAQVKSAQEAAMNPHALAQAACGGCHSVEPFGLSPNAAAPEFPVIANRPGLSEATLGAWLRDAHNYPEEMDFYLEDDEVAQLVDYILTLRREDYQPPI